MKKHFYLPRRAPNARDDLPIGPASPWLAPLAGYSDLPFRLLCREYGASLCVTEMVSAKGLLYRSPGTGDLLLNSGEGSPLMVQLFGSDPRSMGEATSLLGEAGYGLVDCNMGCSVPKVMRQGAGAALLGDISASLAVAKAMLEAAAALDRPCRVGFKLRLGLDESRPVFTELALRLQDLGASWITLHPRWARQGFAGTADWSALAALAPKLDIPLIASGDLLDAENGLDCLRRTGVSGVMYARGALRNPAIFKDHMALAAGGSSKKLDKRALAGLIMRHMELVAECWSRESALFRLRFIVPRYVRHAANARQIRQRLCECRAWGEFEEIMEKYFLDEEPEEDSGEQALENDLKEERGQIRGMASSDYREKQEKN